MPSKSNRSRGKSHIRTSIDRSRVAWVDGSNFEAVIYKGERARTDEDEDYEPHEAELNGLESVRLLLRSGGSYVIFDLSLLKVEEIDALARIFNLAVRTGRPVAEKLDKIAMNAVEIGAERIPMRAYRLDPKVVIRDPDMARPLLTEGTDTNDNTHDRTSP